MGILLILSLCLDYILLQPAVLKIVATWPGRWETDRAFSLGCKADRDILDVVKQYKIMLDQGQG